MREITLSNFGRGTHEYSLAGETRDASTSRQIFVTRSADLSREIAHSGRTIAFPETDNAKIELDRTYVRRNYLKTTPNCRLNWKYVAVGIVPGETSTLFMEVSITNLRPGIM